MARLEVEEETLFQKRSLLFINSRSKVLRFIVLRRHVRMSISADCLKDSSPLFNHALMILIHFHIVVISWTRDF